MATNKKKNLNEFVFDSDCFFVEFSAICDNKSQKNFNINSTFTILSLTFWQYNSTERKIKQPKNKKHLFEPMKVNLMFS